MINIRIPEGMLKQMKDVVGQGLYSNVNDFVRAAIRAQLEEQRKKSVIKSLQESYQHYSGEVKKKLKRVIENLS